MSVKNIFLINSVILTCSVRYLLHIQSKKVGLSLEQDGFCRKQIVIGSHGFNKTSTIVHNHYELRTGWWLIDEKKFTPCPSGGGGKGGTFSRLCVFPRVRNSYFSIQYISFFCFFNFFHLGSKFLCTAQV